MPKNKSYFSEGLKKKKGSGGVSGSVQVPVTEIDERGKTKTVLYQYKFTILYRNPVDKRRLKAFSADHENLRDVYLSQVFQPVLGKSLCPDVINVYDQDKKDIDAASRYLDNCEGTLDEYFASLNSTNSNFAKEIKELRDPNNSRNQLSNNKCGFVISKDINFDSLSKTKPTFPVTGDSAFTVELIKILKKADRNSKLVKNIEKLKNKSQNCAVEIVDGDSIEEEWENGIVTLKVGKNSEFANSLAKKFKENPNSEFGKELTELHAHKRDKLRNGSKHCRVELVKGSNAEPAPAENDPCTLRVGEKSEFAKSLADAIAMSAIGGDHDVNPGNMVVVKDPATGVVKVARIDFGHALGDLLNAPKKFGGQGDSKNPVFDFFNRKEVAGFPKAAPSKLWRDYAGFVPSEILANSLVKLGGKEKREELKQGLGAAKKEMLDLLSFIESNQDPDPKSRAHLVKSLHVIYKNVTGKSMNLSNINSKEGALSVINAMLDGIEQSVLNNANNAFKAGSVMRLQADINAKIKNTGIQSLKIDMLKSFSAAGFSEPDGNVLWFKEDKDGVQYHGSVENYFIDKCMAKIGKELKTNSKELSIEDISDLKIFVSDMSTCLNELSEKSIVTKKQLKEIRHLNANIDKLAKSIENSHSKPKNVQSTSISTFFGRSHKSSQSLEPSKLSKSTGSVGGFADDLDNKTPKIGGGR